MSLRDPGAELDGMVLKHPRAGAFGAEHRPGTGVQEFFFYNHMTNIEQSISYLISERTGRVHNCLWMGLKGFVSRILNVLFWEGYKCKIKKETAVL